MPYYVLKTGMPMYDLERAYGLGLLIYRLSQGETRLRDRGQYYEVEGATPSSTDVSRNEANTLSLVAESVHAWPYAFRSSRVDIPKKQQRATTLLKDHTLDVLSGYASISADAARCTETLPFPMEPSACKGSRDPVRCHRAYGEGGQFKVPAGDWLLAVIGSLHAVRWLYVPPHESVAVIAVPNSDIGVDVAHLQSVMAALAEQYACPVSTLTAVTHWAAQLYRQMWTRRHDPLPWADKFTGLIFGSSVRPNPRSAPKPKEAGCFSLQLFEQLLDDAEGDNVLDHLDVLLRAGAIKGQEALSLSLSAFLARPVLDNYSVFLSTYFRTVIHNEKVCRPKSSTWDVLTKQIAA